MVAVAKQAVVCPVGCGSAHRYHSNVVNQEHNQREDGQAQPAVGHDLIDLIRGGQRTGALLLVAGLDDVRNVHIPLAGDDGLGIVVRLLLGGLDIGFDVGQGVLGDVHLSQDLVVTLEDLDGVPALLFLGHIVQDRLLDVGNGVLHRAGEGVHGNSLGAGRGLDGSLGSFLNAGAPQSGDLHNLTAQLTAQLGHIDLVACLLDQIHHVDGHHNGDAQLGQLGGQVQVPLQVGAVDDVQDGIGALADQIVTGHHFLQSVGGQGVNAGQVGDDHIIVLFQLAFLFLNGNTGPVADELVGTGQGIEQRGLATVGVACQSNPNGLVFHVTYETSLLYFHHFGISLPDGQLIAADVQLDGVTQRRHLADRHVYTLGQAHIHDPAAHSAFAVDLDHLDGGADGNFSQRFHSISS